VNRLREWRTGEDLSLPEVSGLTGYSISHLSLVERGLRHPSPLAKVLIARRLGVPVQKLFPVAAPANDA